MVVGLTLLVSGAVTVHATTSPPANNPANRAHFNQSGHPLGTVPRLGASSRFTQTAGLSNPNCAGCAPPLNFTSGMAVGGGLTGTAGHVTITPVYWAPNGYQYTTNYKSIIDTYVANVAAASSQATNVYAATTQYYQTLSGVTTKIQYVITAGTEIDLTDAFPGNYPSNNTGCEPVSGYTGCVDDADLRTELGTKLAALSKPIDDAHIYMVMFPYSTGTGFPVQTCLLPGLSLDGGNTDSSQACSSDSAGYCAYHSDFFNGPSGNNYALYGNEPFPKVTGCDISVQSPNGDSYADIVLSSFSHEVSETITDWQGAWFDTNGWENGDECAYVYGASGGSTGVAGDGHQSGTSYNQVINGGHYYTQTEFSNEDYALGQGSTIDDSHSTLVSGCIQQEELPTAVFTAPSPTVNVSQAFDGSASSDQDHTSGIASYDWNWGDGTTHGTGATPNHAYTGTGTFSVTLTVTDVDAWQGSVIHSVTVSSGSPTVPGAPTNVVATAGNGQASLTWTAPSANGSPISSYQVQWFVSGISQGTVSTGSSSANYTKTGLNNGTAYTFKVAAVNGIGTGAQSTASNAVTPTSATVPGAPTGVGATAGVGSAYLVWTAPSNGGSAITGYRVTPIMGGVSQTPIPTGSSGTNFTVAGLDSNSSYTFTVVAINAIGTGSDSLPSGVVSPIPGGTYTPLVPARILDTRNGIGVPARAAGPLGAGQTLNLQVTGQGNVPPNGVSSVVLNVTVTNTTAASYLSVWPTGVTQPVVSSLNWVPGKTVANLVEVAVGSGGQVNFFNPAGNTDVIVDVQGWVGDATDSFHRSGLYNPLTPGRDLDTRSGIGAPAAKMTPGQTLNVTVLGVNGVPSSNVSAVVLNVTAVNGSAAGYLTVWPHGSTQPTASNLNFLANQVVPNRVIVGVGTSGQVSIYNPAGNIDVIADVSGYFTDINSTVGGSAFIGEVPTRIYDTRSPGASGPIPAGLFLPLSGAPYAITHVALVLNVTAVSPTQPSYLTVYPDDGNCTAQPPTASDLNFVSGEVVPNMVVATLGPNAGSCALAFDTYNPAGSVDVVFDENGFYGPIALAPPSWAGAVRVLTGGSPVSPASPHWSRAGLLRGTSKLVARRQKAT